VSTIRPASAANIDGLARLWHDAWVETHAPLIGNIHPVTKRLR
jgi:hypothetical protein